MILTYLKVDALGLHLNGDESMVMGAAFHAANMSKTIRARKCGMTDITPFTTTIEMTNIPSEISAKHDEWSTSAPLFEKQSKLNKKRSIKITHESDISIKLALQEGTEELLKYPTLQHTIGHYNITGIEEFAKEISKKRDESGLDLPVPTVKISFELDSSGMIVLTKAEATSEEPEQPEVEEEEEEQLEEQPQPAADEEKLEENEKAEEEEKESTAADEKKTEGEESEKKIDDKKQSKKAKKKNQKYTKKC